jgi:hypothetical protein
VGKALEMLREYRESGRVPSRDMVLLCASGCATHGQWRSVQTLVLEDLKALGYEVGVEGYLALLTAFAHGGEPDMAHECKPLAGLARNTSGRREMGWTSAVARPIHMPSPADRP